MKKYTYCLFITLLLWVGCSDSNDTPEVVIPDPLEAFYKEAIIGSWAINTVTVDSVTEVYEHTEGCEKDLFQFYNSDIKPFEFEELVVTNCPQCAECSITQTALEWELNGNKISLFFGEQLILVYEIVSVTEDNFVYKFQFDIDNDNVIENVEVNADYHDPFGDFD